MKPALQSVRGETSVAPEMESATPSAPDRATRWSSLVGKSLLFLVLALIFFPETWSPDVDLDPSWRMALPYVTQGGFQFGREFIFTAGPLGFLASQTYTPVLFHLTQAWNVALAVGCAFFVLSVLRGYNITRQVLGVVFFLTVVRGNFDQLYMIVLVMAGLQLVRPTPPTRRRLVITAVVMALFSLIKFTLSLQAGVILAVVSLHAILAGRRRDAGVFAGSFVAAYLILWLACGQNPLNLPAYWINSLEISLGYGETMSLPPPAGALGLALIIAVSLILYGILGILLAADRWRAAAQALMFASATYLTWKHGFVRADGHMLHFLTFGLLIAVLHPLVFDAPTRLRWAPLTLTFVATLAALLAYLEHFPVAAKHGLTALNDDLLGKLQTASNPAGYAERLRTSWDQAARRFRLVDIPRTVGDETVDVLAHYQGVALLHGFNYLPRPIPQSYSAYTPRLARLNAEHFDSDRGPQWVLQRIRSIDNRFPTLDDSFLNLALVRRYSYVLQDGEYLLWRRLPQELGHDFFRPTPGEMRRTRVGEAVGLADLEELNVWLRLEVRPTLLGRLRGFLYQPAPVELELEDTTGRVQRFKLLPKMAASGFLLNPLMRDQFDWLRFVNGLRNARVRWFRVIIAPSDRKYFRSEVRYAFDPLPAPPLQDERIRGRERERQTEQLLLEVGGFRTLPVGIDAGAPLGGAVAGKQPAVLVHAPSEMLFAVPAGATSFRARYGIADGAFTGDARVAGAGVSVEFKSPSGTKVLFERWLDPLRVAEDRGLQELNLDLTNLGPGSLYVRNFVRESNAWAWTVWRDIEIVPTPDAARATERRILTGDDYIVKRYGGFAELPLAIRGATSIIAVNVDGHDMIQVHAPSEVALQVPAGAQRAVGRFALRLPDLLNTANSDGAEFIVVWKSGDDERVLFRRFLDPVAIAADRGPQNFSADLAGLPGTGTLVLRITPGKNGDATSDWTCWSDVAIGDPAPLPVIKSQGGRSATPTGPTTVSVAMFKGAGFKTIPTSAAAQVPAGPAALADGLPAIQLHAPSYMVFPVTPGATRVRARFGMNPGGASQSDGVDYLIEWFAPDGERRVLFRRTLRPQGHPADAQAHRIDLPLDGISGGELRFRVETGPVYNAAYDWSAWGDVEIVGAPPGPDTETIPFTLLPAPVPRATLRPKLSPEQTAAIDFSHAPVEWTGDGPPTLSEVDNVVVLQVHAPGSIMMLMPADAREVSGRFGFPEPAYKSPEPTDGAEFIIEWVGPDGDKRVLFQRFLNPRDNIDDVGLQSFRVDLTSLPPGDLLFRTAAGPNGNASSDWTCWQGIKIK